MVDTVISSFTTAQIGLTANDTLWVEAVGSIVESDVAVLWDLAPVPTVPPGVVIVNDGQIVSTGDRAIDTDNSPAGVVALYLTNNGIIGSSADDALKIGEDLFEGSIVVIENHGTIEATGTGGSNGQALDLNDLETIGAEVTNYAFGVISAADADAIRPGNGGTVTNYGLVFGGAADPTDGNDAIDFQEHDDGEVINKEGGTIEGTRHGITGDLKNATIDNAGEIIGQRGSGINLDLPDGATATDHIANIVNHGDIEGNAEGDQDGDGIDTDGLIKLDNHGAIRAFGTWDSGLSEGVTVGGGTINNHAGALIYSVERAINVDDSNEGSAFAVTEITNEGTIEGGNGEAIVIVGTFADIITNKGIIIGSIATDDGDDTINLYTQATTSGGIDGGDGANDAVNLKGDGVSTLSEVTNVEDLNVEGGEWSLLDMQVYSNGVKISAGAGLSIGDGGTSGDLDADVDVAADGVFAVDRSDALTFDEVISGDGAFEQRGAGTTTLNQTNSFTGGATLIAGTLVLAAFEAAGTGDITFSGGSQTLVIEDAALAPAAALTEMSFANTVRSFGKGDAIDLSGLAFAAGATVDYDKATDVMTVSSYGDTVTLMVADPKSNTFTAENDGQGGTRIVLKNEGGTIGGTKKDDVIDATTAPFGRKLPTKADDTIRGRKGDDKIAGLAGNDILKGGKGDDDIRGGSGDDLIAGGRGKNVLKGGKGYDAFLFDTKIGDGKDAAKGSAFSFSKITDFNPKKDLFLLDQKIFTALSLGPLPDSQFAKGKTAKDADDYILYKAGKGAVYYDPDGVGGADAVQFAQVNSGTDLSAASFLIV